MPLTTELANEIEGSVVIMFVNRRLRNEVLQHKSIQSVEI